MALEARCIGGVISRGGVVVDGEASPVARSPVLLPPLLPQLLLLLSLLL